MHAKLSRHLKYYLLSALFPMIVFMATSTHAEMKVFESSHHHAALVELYTSEGCSSCPPAEKWFSNLTHDARLWKEIFPIAFHVDYWDYLGWKDIFANPQFSLRQTRYEYLGHTRNVATPGFVVDGKGWNGWFRGRSLPPISKTKNSGSISVSLKNQAIKVKFSHSDQSKTKLKVHIATLGFGISVPIRGGENRGKNLKHDFVVLNYQESSLFETENYWLAHLKHQNTTKFDTHRKALIAWVSEKGDPSPIQVTGGWL